MNSNHFELGGGLFLAARFHIGTQKITDKLILLASLHASQKARDDFWDITNEIDEILSR